MTKKTYKLLKRLINYELNVKMKIFLVLFFIILLLLLIQMFLLDTSFNYEYLSNFVNNFIPNVITIFIAVFLIDYLIKQKELKDLKIINRSKSKSILFFVNRLASKILIFFNELTQKDVLSRMEEEKDMDMNFVIEKIRSYKEKEILVFFNKKFFSSADYKKMSKDLEGIKYLRNIIERETKIIKKLIKGLYPRASVELSEFFESEVYGFIGSVEAMAMMLNLSEKQSFIKKYKLEIESKGQDYNKELKKFQSSFTRLMPYVSPSPNLFIDFLERIVEISDKSKDNSLFFKH